MTNLSQDNQREEVKRALSAPRRGGTVGRILKVLLILAAVLGIVMFAAYRDLDNMDSIRRLFSYNKITQGEQGKSQLWSFDADRTNTFALLNGRLIVASTTGISLLGSDGEIVYHQSARMTNPAIAVGGNTAAVYDVGGTSAYLLGSSGLVRDLSALTGEGLLALSVNSSDYLALTAEKSGYKSAVSAYDPTGECLFTFNSSDHYVFDACVLRDCKHLAAVTLGEADGAFSSTLNFYSLTGETPISVNTLNSSLVLSLGSIGSSLACVADDRLTTFDAAGALGGSCRYEYPYLRAQDLSGTDFAALLLSRYRSGSTLRLVTVSGKGEVKGSQDISGEVLSLSAAGKYVAALQSDRLTIYTSDLAEYAVLEDTAYARNVLMQPDGTALLIGSSSAWLYIP